MSTTGGGNLPCLRTKTNPLPSRAARAAPKMNPRDSIPATASIVCHSAGVSSASSACSVASKCARNNGEISRNRMPGCGKSATFSIYCFSSDMARAYDNGNRPLITGESTMSANTPAPYGLQQLRAWIAAGKRPPIAETLQFYLLEADEGRAVFGGVPGVHAYNPFDVAHGGYAATLLDSACGCAV